MNSFSKRAAAGPFWVRIAYKKTGHPAGDGLFNFVMGISGFRDVCFHRYSGMKFVRVSSLNYRGSAQ